MLPMKAAKLHSRFSEIGFAHLIATKGYDRLSAFLKRDDSAELEIYLAANPTAGDIIPGTGGVRKLRWAASGRGKRGGARIIYYYHSLVMPLFLIAAYAKNTKSTLTNAEKSQLRKLTAKLKKHYAEEKESINVHTRKGHHRRA